MTARGRRQARPEMRKLSSDRAAEFLILHIIIHQYSYHMYYFRNQIYTYAVIIYLKDEGFIGITVARGGSRIKYYNITYVFALHSVVIVRI